MLAPIVRDFLEGHRARFTETVHSRAPTALAEAHKDHTPAGELAKTVVVRAGDCYALAVLPADTRIDWMSLARALGLRQLALATEREMDELFPDLETGAVPPLGPLFAMPVYVDRKLGDHNQIAFNGGSHTSTIHMTFDQFCALVGPRIGSFAVPE